MTTDIHASTVSATMRTLDLRGVQQHPVEGRHVWKLQSMLNVWLHSGDAEPVPTLLVTDGLGGVLTRGVLVDFQAAHELEADAVAGPRTWRALFEFDVVAAG